jgi:hypothetical protein
MKLTKWKPMLTIVPIEAAAEPLRKLDLKLLSIDFIQSGERCRNMKAWINVFD